LVFQKLKNEIESNVNTCLDEIGLHRVAFNVEPAKEGFGDVSCNVCFLVAKQEKKFKLIEIAQKISEHYNKHSGKLVSHAKHHQSGHLNFSINWNEFTPLLLDESTKNSYGSIDLGKNTRIVVEHTSVNPNKALHMGHVRNIAIGDSIARILNKANYDVKVLNYIDDFGLQVADLLVGIIHYKISPDQQKGEKYDRKCSEVYEKTTVKYEHEKPEFVEKIRKDFLTKLETGDPEISAVAQFHLEKILRAQLETCWRLNANYNCLNFESHVLQSGLWNTIFAKLKKKNIVTLEKDGKNKDCWVFKDKQDDDKVIVRSNGTATYIAKDIPYAAWKLGLVPDTFSYKKYAIQGNPSDEVLWETNLPPTNEIKQNFTANQVITVIDSRQSRLQNIVKSIIENLDAKPDSYIHLSYEAVKLTSETIRQYLGLPTEKDKVNMSGRKGLVLYADSVLELLCWRIRQVTEKKYPKKTFEELQQLVEPIAIGTIRYEMVRQDLDKIITYDLSKSLSLEGDTAAYVQYSHVRAVKILEKTNQKLDIPKVENLLTEDLEKSLLKKIALFENKVQDAAQNYSPKVIARYCYDLAVSFNAFYAHIQVLNVNNSSLVNARLCLVKSFQSTMEKALDLIGIVAAKQM